MSLSKLAFAAVAAALFVSPALAQDAPGGAPAHHGMMGGMFSPEERMMLFADTAKATAGMSDDQRHAWRHDQREHFMAMSDADKAKMKADLDARWAALSPAQQADIKAKAEAWRAAHMGGDHGGGQ